jgi:hypothetical protein
MDLLKGFNVFQMQNPLTQVASGGVRPVAGPSGIEPTFGTSGVTNPFAQIKGIPSPTFGSEGTYGAGAFGNNLGNAYAAVKRQPAGQQLNLLIGA